MRVNQSQLRLVSQVEIYAFGIEKAYRPELASVASNLQGHVYLIPSFHLFGQLARSLHGGKSVDDVIKGALWRSGKNTRLSSQGTRVRITRCRVESWARIVHPALFQVTHLVVDRVRYV